MGHMRQYQGYITIVAIQQTTGRLDCHQNYTGNEWRKLHGAVDLLEGHSHDNDRPCDWQPDD